MGCCDEELRVCVLDEEHPMVKKRGEMKRWMKIKDGKKIDTKSEWSMLCQLRQRLAGSAMNAEIVSSLLTQEVPAGAAAAVPVDHLDYGYIEKCTDVKHLGKILRVLRSGDEGIYPHLIEFCESRLERLDPRSRALRKDNPPATAACLSGDEWSQITDELKNAVSNGQKKTSQKKVLPRNYIEWDQYDVDRECDKIDGNVTTKDPPAIINSRYLKIRSKMNTTALTEQEKVLVANREKVKGNEAFKANDYEEAVVYYSRSLSVVPTVAGYNNRAQSEINLQHWHNALNDCQKALEMEPGNMKVLKQQGNYQMAAEDLRSVLQAEPQNITATIDSTVVTIRSPVYSIDGTVVTIRSPVYSIDGTVVTIRSSVYSIDGTVVTIRSPVYSIDGTVVTIRSPVYSIDSTVVTIRSPVYPIDSTVVTIRSPVYSIDSTVVTIRSPVYSIDGTVVTIRSPVYSIDSTVVTIRSPVYSIDGTVVTIRSPVYSIDGTVVTIRSPVYSIDSTVVTIRSPVYSIDPITIDSTVVTIRSPVYSIGGTLVTIRSPVYSIDGTVVTIRSPVYSIDGTVVTIRSPKLLVEVDKKLNQCQPEKERKSKKIVIQEVENEQGEDQRGE
ncbi:unnamed protein product [Coregonus sp. 'balchen']|nr:unnamed protein product [Coregonus sp. 'balchen']